MGTFFKGLFSKKKAVTDESSSLEGVQPSLLYQSRPSNEFKFKRFIPLTTSALIGLMTADLASVYLRSQMIPSHAPPSKKLNLQTGPGTLRMDYNDILARNIFNSDGMIPDINVAGGEEPTGPAKESTLPLNLVGTIVHANPGKSVATIELKGSADKILPYLPNDDIAGMAILLKVERKKAYIRNLQSRTIEYIKIKDDTAITFQKKPMAQQDGPVMKESDDTYAISRSDLESQMNNLPELLTKARAVPNVTGPGRVDGFRIVEVDENSIFSKFGIKVGDIIKGVDGENLDSPARAMELYNGLRTKNRVTLQVDRNGRVTTMTYNIR